MTFCTTLKKNFSNTKLRSATKALSVSPDILADITVEFGGSNNPNAVTESISGTTNFNMFYAVTTRRNVWSRSFAERTVFGVV
jgi:hypothetical protein